MTQEELLKKFNEKFPQAAQAPSGVAGEGRPSSPAAPSAYSPLGVKGYLTMKVEAQELPAVAKWLKEQAGFDYLDMITGVDLKEPVNVRGFISDPNPNVFLPEGATPQIEAVVRSAVFPYKDAMEAVYCLSNLKERLKVFLKVELPRGNPRVPSLVPLFKAADWQEREAWDLLGIEFAGHPNLTKILTPEFIQGHPLRKDYIHVKDRFD